MYAKKDKKKFEGFIAAVIMLLLSLFVYSIIVAGSLKVAGIAKVSDDTYWAIICSGGYFCSKLVPFLIRVVFPDVNIFDKKHERTDTYDNRDSGV